MMEIEEERRFHRSQDKVNLHVERRITRLEILLYVLLSLSAVNLLGIHILDTIYLLHP